MLFQVSDLERLVNISILKLESHQLVSKMANLMVLLLPGLEMIKLKVHMKTEGLELVWFPQMFLPNISAKIQSTPKTIKLVQVWPLINIDHYLILKYQNMFWISITFTNFFFSSLFYLVQHQVKKMLLKQQYPILMPKK